MAESFGRPKEGFRFAFEGIKLNSKPDTLKPGKYALAQNVRAISDSSIQTRPGMTQKFVAASTGLDFPTDIAGFATGSPPSPLTAGPRYLAHTALDRIYLDNGTSVGTLAGGGSPGAFMVPLRPNQSPSSYMYIVNGADYQKFSAPPNIGSNVVVQSKVGIAEPQTAPDACAQAFSFFQFMRNAAVWANAGTAGAITDATRTADTVAAVLADPTVPTTRRVSVGVTSTIQYQAGQVVTFTGAHVNTAVIQDIYPPVQGGAILTVAAIRYYSGNTGLCVVVPSQLVNDTLQRGSLVKFSGSNEVCLVLNVTLGPNGTTCFETSTTVTHTVGETLSGVPAIAVYYGDFLIAPGDAISSTDMSYQVTAGIGTITTTFGALGTAAANPFASVIFGNGLILTPQEDDYLHISVNVDDPTQLIEAKLMFDVGDGTFTQNFFYYTVRPSDIELAITNTQTQLAASQVAAQRQLIDSTATDALLTNPNRDNPEGINLITDTVGAANLGGGGDITIPSSDPAIAGASQWTELTIPIRALTRVGNDQTKTLAQAVKAQVLINAANTVNILVSSMWVGGGGQVDTGDAGAPYLYRVRPRSMVTGAVGNPSPATRYGITPHRQPVTVQLPSAAYDAQIDTWDIFRYGGSVTSWRYVGSTPSSNSAFTDNYYDDAVAAGDALDFDNHEPWPTVGLPNNNTATSVVGTVAVVTSSDQSITRYLPGTLVQLGGANVYTLRTRPTQIAGSSYLLQFVENASNATNIPFSINEPAIANQKLYGLWGPDAAGTLFACGDPLRQGSLYFTKNYNADSAPDSYNLEITSPSEPLVGGEVLDGLSFVASSARWWALYPQPDNPAQRYNIVQQPMTRGLAAIYGHCNDGQRIYFVAEDGIYANAESLTDADLYNLFPHDGVPGVAVTYNGVTIQPPNYFVQYTFRLEYCNGYLYFIYQDATFTLRCLVYDIKRKAWSVDEYSPRVTVAYHPPQLAISTQAAYVQDVLLFGTANGNVVTQAANTNDLGGAIIGIVAVGEFDGGDVRAPKQWGDAFVDLTPAAPAGVSATPMALGAAVAAATIIPTSTSRQRVPVSVGGIVVSDFLGLMLQWTDDFTQQSAPTILSVWQPSFSIQPARTIGYATFGADFGGNGFGHIGALEIAYVSAAPVTLTITVFDGMAPQPITLPNTGGQYQKALFQPTANKGQLFKFQFASAQPFQIFLSDSDLHFGSWQRTGPYVLHSDLGANAQEDAVL